MLASFVFTIPRCKCERVSVQKGEEGGVQGEFQERIFIVSGPNDFWFGQGVRMSRLPVRLSRLTRLGTVEACPSLEADRSAGAVGSCFCEHLRWTYPLAQTVVGKLTPVSAGLAAGHSKQVIDVSSRDCSCDGPRQLVVRKAAGKEFSQNE